MRAAAAVTKQRAITTARFLFLSETVARTIVLFLNNRIFGGSVSALFAAAHLTKHQMITICATNIYTI